MFTLRILCVRNLLTKIKGMTSTNMLTGIGSVFEKNKRAIKVIL